MQTLTSLTLAAFTFGSLGAVAHAEGEPGKEEKPAGGKKKPGKKDGDKHCGADGKKGGDKKGGDKHCGADKSGGKVEKT